MTEKNTDKEFDFDINPEEEKAVFPCIALRGASVFSHTIVHFDIGRERSKKALEKAMKEDSLLYVASQKDEDVMIPTFADLYPVGALVKVKQMLKITGDSVRVLVEGVMRAEVAEIETEDEYLSCQVNVIADKVFEEFLDISDKASLKVLKEKFIEYSSITGKVSDEAVDDALEEEDPSVLINKITIQLKISNDRKQAVYGMKTFSERLEKLLFTISEEIDIAIEERRIARKVKENVDTSQKEYYLKERIKVIREELGEDEDLSAEADRWMQQLKELELEEKTEEKVAKEIKRFSKMAQASAESAVVRTYIETILDMPWKESSELNSDINKAEKILEADHYGLEKVKERVLEYLSVITLADKIKGPILCLAGPPGVGKTSVAKSIAKATGREYIRMSLGGVRDEAEIRGHRRTYIGAIPGNVISNIRSCGKNNPLFLFDEIDKIGSDFKGDPASALLEVLDPEQNNTFTDHYLDVPFDLSKVMFITTANDISTIPAPLLDRMEVIELSGYTEEEKVKIASKYLEPKQIEENGLKDYKLTFSEGAERDIINYYTRESGVRNLERQIGKACRKAARKVVTGEKNEFSITKRNLEDYLGKKKFRYDKVEGESEVGLVTGMAWTRVGGDTLFIETAVLPGKGKLQVTGNLGDVMKESAYAAISYTRSISDNLGIQNDFYEKKDIHIHVPEGAVPKDGPSAGVSLFTSAVSALTGIPVRKDVAMTGEITLRGKVLPVGGIREKVLAAHRAGIKKILLPEENLKDTDEIPENVKKELEFVTLKYADETLKHALIEIPKGDK